MRDAVLFSQSFGHLRHEVISKQVETRLTESSKVSRFTKEEFEAYQKMHHDRWDHNVMVPGVFKEFAAEIDAKIAENVADAKHESAKK